MFKRTVVWLLILALSAGLAIWVSRGSSSSTTNGGDQTSEISQTVATEEPAGGQSYASYSQSELANQYDRHILFFYASWCPECRAFKQSLQNGSIPGDVQILEVNFDTATDLKQKYGVTLQSTFVEVDAGGELLAKWVGYGRGKTFADIEAGLGQG